MNTLMHSASEAFSRIIDNFFGSKEEDAASLTDDLTVARLEYVSHHSHDSEIFSTGDFLDQIN